MALSDDLKAIEAQVTESLIDVQDMKALEDLRIKALGKKGQLTALMRMM